MMVSSSSSSSSSSPPDPRGRKLQYPIGDHDWISKLPDDLLQTILSRLSTEEAVQTSVLSARWINVWKWRHHLVLDMGKVLETTPIKLLHEVSVKLASSMTKSLRNHRGHLKSCIIQHYISQCKDGTLESWIHTATRVKHTKDLTLINYIHGYEGRYKGRNVLRLSPDTFSHHSLTSLSICGFSLIGPHAFSNCGNLKTLKLLNMVISQASVVSRVLAACSSLEVVVLQIDFLTRREVLKIENKNLKFLQVTFPSKINKMEVYAACLDVLDIRLVRGKRESFVFAAPNIGRFNRNYWVSGSVPNPHLSYNVSYLTQEGRNMWHKLLVTFFHGLKRHGSLSVSVDVTNPKEVEILKEVLLLWTTNMMMELEILFKNNSSPREESECPINGTTHKNLLEDAKPFPNADFRVYNVRLYNFKGNKEEFALASHFVMQKTVTMRMMIETSSFPPTEKLKVEAAVAKLMELPKGNKRLRIKCF